MFKTEFGFNIRISGVIRVGRSERIRTSGPCLPKAVLYQAELHSDTLVGVEKSLWQNFSVRI